MKWTLPVIAMLFLGCSATLPRVTEFRNLHMRMIEADDRTISRVYSGTKKDDGSPSNKAQIKAFTKYLEDGWTELWLSETCKKIFECVRHEIAHWDAIRTPKEVGEQFQIDWNSYEPGAFASPPYQGP